MCTYFSAGEEQVCISNGIHRTEMSSYRHINYLLCNHQPSTILPFFIFSIMVLQLSKGVYFAQYIVSGWCGFLQHGQKDKPYLYGNGYHIKMDFQFRSRNYFPIVMYP